MTTFGDQVYQYGGSPVGHGIPVRFGNTQNKGAGKVYFVNPTTGSDGNVGTRMDKPLATIAKAYSLVTSNNNDTIVLSASSTLTEDDQLSVTKNRVHFLGLDGVGRYYGARSKWAIGVTTGTAIATVLNTGVGNSFTNIKFISDDTLATSLYAFVEGGEYTMLDHCEIYKGTDLDQATAADLVMNGDSPIIKNCTIGSLAQQVTAARTNVLVTKGIAGSGKVSRDVTFDNCQFWLNSTSATASHIHTTTATDVERLFLVKNSVMAVNKVSTATVGDAVIIGATLTVGQILLFNTCNLNSTAIGTTGSVGLFYYGPEIATAATAGNPVAVTD